MSFGSVELNPGTGGSKVAADIVTEGGEPREFQRIKLVWGPESTITPVDVGANALPVQDGGNSLTVDTPQLPAALVSGRLDVNVGAGTVTVQGAATEDDAAPANPTGVPGLLRRRDTLATETSADGDWTTPNATPQGAQYVALTVGAAVVGGNASGLFSQGPAASDAPVTGSPLFTGARASTAVPSAVSADGDAVGLWANRLGILEVALRDEAGDTAMDGTNNAVRASIVASTALVQVIGPDNRDAPVSTQPLLAGARGSTAVPAAVSADGDTVDFWASRNGALNVIIRDSTGDSAMDDTNNAVRVNVVTGTVAISGTVDTELPAAGALSDDMVNPTTPLVGACLMVWDGNWDRAVATSGRLAIQGTVAHDGAINFNPIHVSARAFATAPTAVSADDDAVLMWANRLGALQVGLRDGTGDSVMDDANNAVRVTIASGAPAVAQFAEDSVHASGDNGIQMLAVRRDSASSGVSADGDYAALSVNANGALRVLADSGSAVTVFGVSNHDGPVANTPVTISARASTAAPTAVSADDDTTYLWASRRGALHTAMRDDDGDSCMDNTNAALRVNVINLVDEYVEDAVGPANPEGPALMMIRNDARGSAGTSADGDWVGARGSLNGELYVDTELPAAVALADNTSNPTVPGVGAFQMYWDGATWDRAKGDSTGGANVQGGAAIDALITGNPNLMGGRASSAAPTAVSADNDAQALWTDRRGRLITAQQCDTTTDSSVSDTTTSTTLLSANTLRKGATITNTSTAILYIRCAAAAASATAHHAILAPNGTWECPFGYTGEIRGVWATDPNTGSAVIGEFT